MINSLEAVHTQDISSKNLLNKMAEMKKLARGDIQNKRGSSPISASFADVLNRVNHSQKNAASISRKFINGDPSVNMSEVLATSQSAKIEMESIRIARNKLIELSKDILNTQI
ncbi:flagellar hook-basal body complex protein FliE [Photobacterium kishitanii]|uniref:Flagellar hook-basal body complex protein FliE n=1 Tax=Photobacterium kishitanii TaxID=318456 RepID=A0A2T3KMV0_9GAMM|nr:flagellar hook-basal body complex protein FliE [Photobacterium kishitanii]PSV01108.1 hypothetical protein C9J27_03555 [Photobacterium kishitanii]